MADLNGAADPAAANEPSLRDDLAAEFDKAAGEPDAPAPEPAPEPAVSETPVVETRQRGPDGKFIPKSTEGEPAPLDGKAPDAIAPAVKTADVTPAGAPPPGWSSTAKAEYAKLPEPVKQAIARREEEINKGFAVLKDFKPLEPYIAQARATGTTLPEALERYTAAEALLERDPIAGLSWLCKNYNINPQQLVEAIGGQPAPQPQPGAQQFDPRMLQPFLEPLTRKLTALEQSVVGRQTQEINGQIETFFSDTKAHPYVENVADQMAEIIKFTHASGHEITLQQAYDKACWDNPEIRELLINQRFDTKTADQAALAKATANQARRAGASITGAPAATPVPGAPQTDSLRADLETAFAAGRA